MEKLKPCPFCGSKDINYDKEFIRSLGDREWQVYCGCCLAGIWDYELQEAIKLWNTRI